MHIDAPRNNFGHVVLALRPLWFEVYAFSMRSHIKLNVRYNKNLISFKTQKITHNDTFISNKKKSVGFVERYIIVVWQIYFLRQQIETRILSTTILYTFPVFQERKFSLCLYRRRFDLTYNKQNIVPHFTETLSSVSFQRIVHTWSFEAFPSIQVPSTEWSLPCIHESWNYEKQTRTTSATFANTCRLCAHVSDVLITPKSWWDSIHLLTVCCLYQDVIERRRWKKDQEFRSVSENCTLPRHNQSSTQSNTTHLHHQHRAPVFFQDPSSQTMCLSNCDVLLVMRRRWRQSWTLF